MSKSNETSPTTAEAGAVGFDFPSHTAGLGGVLSTAIGHQQILHGVAGYRPESDDDDMSEEYDDIDDDEQSDADESSPDELE